MSDVADRLRALADAAPNETQLTPNACWFWGAKSDRELPMARFEAQAQLFARAPVLARGYADALDKTGEWIPAEEELLSRARAAGDTLGAACHSYARDVLVGLQTELLASAARLFPEDAA